MKFVVEFIDYEPGSDREITASRLERLLQKLLDKDMSDGYVTVTEKKDDA